MGRYLTHDRKVEILTLNKKKMRILEEKMWTVFKRDVITDNMVELYNSYESEWKRLEQENINLKIR